MDRRQQGSPPRRNPRTGRPYRRVRDRVKQDQSLCPLCEAQGLTVAGDEVDHIVPLSRGGAEQDPVNLQHLCVPCHKAKTRREQGGDQSTAAPAHGHQAPPNVHTRNQVRRQRQAWRAFVAELR